VNEWIAVANLVMNTLFIPLLVLLVQIKTNIATGQVQLIAERNRIDAHSMRMDQIDRHVEATDDRFLQHVLAREAERRER
jgi:hypothetical protein